MNFCNKCGGNITPSAKHCHSCGNNLTTHENTTKINYNNDSQSRNANNMPIDSNVQATVIHPTVIGNNPSNNLPQVVLIQNQQQAREPKPTPLSGIISLTTSIIGIMLVLCHPVFALFSVIGFISGCIGRKHGIAVTGLVLSIIGIAWFMFIGMAFLSIGEISFWFRLWNAF